MPPLAQKSCGLEQAQRLYLRGFWSHFGPAWLPAPWEPASESPWAGLKFQVLSWKHIRQEFGLHQEVFWFAIFSAWHLLISFRDVPFLEKNNSKNACLTDELRKCSNQACPFRDLGLSLTSHWERRLSPNLKYSTHRHLPGPPLLAWYFCWLVLRVSLETASFDFRRCRLEGVSVVSSITPLGCDLKVYPKRWPLFNPNPELSSSCV